VVAYNLSGEKWPDNEVNDLDIWIPGYDPHKGAWGDSYSAWNAAGTAVHFNEVASMEQAEVIAHSYDWGDDGRDGLCITYTYEGIIYFAYAHVNTHYTPSYPYNKVRSVATHELGHSVGLDEMGTGFAVVMNYASNWRYDEWGVYTPQSDDIDGLYDLYY